MPMFNKSAYSIHKHTTGTRYLFCETPANAVCKNEQNKYCPPHLPQSVVGITNI